VKFRTNDVFGRDAPYRLLPFRFRRLPWDSERVLVTSLAGQWVVVGRQSLERIVTRCAAVEDSSALDDLEAGGMLIRTNSQPMLVPLLAQLKSRRSTLACGPQLHLFVVSLRCDHSCKYCQVSRQEPKATRFDMTAETATAAVERLFEWPSKSLTVEFQGGEPFLAFDRIRMIVEQVELKNLVEHREIRFVIASTLQHLDEERLEFCKQHDIQLSTSLDGPASLHNGNRPLPTRDSHKRTVSGIGQAREALGHDAVSALTTLTRSSLMQPKAIVDEYVRLGFASIFLRPLSPYGFAKRTEARTSYSMGEFLSFYRDALDYLIEINLQGTFISEVYATLILRMLLTPKSHGYVDLRSPTGAGLGAMVYNYDGRVYPSDEARMLAAMGDESFCLGAVNQSPTEWFESKAMRAILANGVAESTPGCTDCPYLPFCGSDPVDSYARQGDLLGHRPSSSFCEKHTGLFELLFEELDRADPDRMRVFNSWVRQRPLDSILRCDLAA
jgi:His-Xaa-Ser system radical SAM maturase HxsB